MRTLLLISGIVLAATSCVGIPGDGIVRVTGDLVSPRGSDIPCNLLLRSTVEPGRVLETTVVTGEFAYNFMVPPTHQTYLVEVVCAGATKGTMVVTRPQQRAADFGRIAL